MIISIRQSYVSAPYTRDGQPVGQALFRRTPDGVMVDQADDQIGITADLVGNLESGGHLKGVEYAEGLFRIVGANRTVVYRLDELEDSQDHCPKPWWHATKIRDTGCAA